MVRVDSGYVAAITAVASPAERRLMRKICSVFAMVLTEHRAVMVSIYPALTAVIMTAMITEYARKTSPPSCKSGLPGPS